MWHRQHRPSRLLRVVRAFKGALFMQAVKQLWIRNLGNVWAEFRNISERNQVQLRIFVEYSVVCILNSAVKRSAQNSIKKCWHWLGLIGKFWNICGQIEGIHIEKFQFHMITKKCPLTESILFRISLLNSLCELYVLLEANPFLLIVIFFSLFLWSWPFLNAFWIIDSNFFRKRTLISVAFDSRTKILNFRVISLLVTMMPNDIMYSYID